MAVICERFDSLGFDDPKKHYQLGILGGTFDPIHVGHLACAEEVRVAYGLDAVVFIPTAQPVFKRDRQIAPAQRRFAMCQLATRNNPHFDVSPIEIERGGDTYTVDTLRVLREYYPDNVELLFIAGADAINTITKWKDSNALGSMAKFIGVSRPGYFIAPSEKELLARKEANIDVSYLEITALSISSSDIRQRIADKSSIRYLVPSEVRCYIANHQLYRYNEEK